MTLRLNSRALFLARLDRALSSRELADAAGISASTLNRLETGRNPNVSTLSLIQYLRLCDALGVGPDTLIERAEQPPSEDCDDSRLLLGLIHAIGGQLHIDVLADSTGWTLDRCLLAVDNLNAQLQPVGLTVYRRSAMYQLRATGNDHEAALKRYRNHPRANQRTSLVSPGRARQVHAALTRPFPSDALRDSTRRDVSILIATGILELDSDRNHTLTEAARYSLLLDE